MRSVIGSWRFEGHQRNAKFRADPMKARCPVPSADADMPEDEASVRPAGALARLSQHPFQKPHQPAELNHRRRERPRTQCSRAVDCGAYRHNIENYQPGGDRPSRQPTALSLSRSDGKTRLLPGYVAELMVH
jgi:hypothetical protein